eukprot:2393181-Rhodomonas_salina.2
MCALIPALHTPVSQTARAQFTDCTRQGRGTQAKVPGSRVLGLGGAALAAKRRAVRQPAHVRSLSLSLSGHESAQTRAAALVAERRAVRQPAGVLTRVVDGKALVVRDKKHHPELLMKVHHLPPKLTLRCAKTGAAPLKVNSVQVVCRTTTILSSHSEVDTQLPAVHSTPESQFPAVCVW